MTRPPVLLQSEYVAERDERLRFMSGFSGSHGVAVVTDSKAALWTDGRYLLQADNELGCDWLLMGRGEVHVSTRTQPPSDSIDYREENCISNSQIIWIMVFIFEMLLIFP